MMESHPLLLYGHDREIFYRAETQNLRCSNAKPTSRLWLHKCQENSLGHPRVKKTRLAILEFSYSQANLSCLPATSIVPLSLRLKLNFLPKQKSLVTT